MHHPFKQRPFPAGNPIANALVVIAGACVIGLSIVLGVVAFIALGSVLLVLAAIIGIRVWWFNRKLGKHYAGKPPGRGQSPDVRIDIIEGEYDVVSRDERGRDR